MFQKYQEFGTSGDCRLCDGTFEFYNQSSTTIAENIGNVVCYKQSHVCDPGWGVSPGSSNTDTSCNVCE